MHHKYTIQERTRHINDIHFVKHRICLLKIKDYAWLVENTNEIGAGGAWSTRIESS